MNKIKILFTGLSQNMGGIESFLINVYRNIDKEKFDISFLIFKGKKVCFYDELKAKNVKFFEITSRKENYFKFVREIKQVYKENNFDYIHFNLVNFNCPERIILAKKYSSAKLIIHSHNGNIVNTAKNQLLHSIGKIILKNIDCIRLACGEEAGKFLFGNKNYDIITNGIEVNKFKFNNNYKDEYRKKFNINNEFVIGLIARFDEQKNHSFLIDIFNEYVKLNKNCKLVLVGEGRLQEQIKNKVKKLELSNKVLFLGKRTDSNKLYSLFDVYVMPSLFEGLSISIIEAQANGLQCYTSTDVDKNSNITGNVNFLPLTLAPEQWAKKISEKDNKRDERIYEKIPEIYDIEYTVSKLTKIYINK